MCHVLFAGIIMQYILLREGVEIYHSQSDLSYTDDNVILPYNTYTYTLRACTQKGCIESESVSLYCILNILLLCYIILTSY